MVPARQIQPGVQRGGIGVASSHLAQPRLQQVVARDQRKARHTSARQPAELLALVFRQAGHQVQRGAARPPLVGQGRHHAAPGHPHARQRVGHPVGQGLAFGIAGLLDADLHIQHERQVQVDAAFFHDTCGAAVGQHRVAGQREGPRIAPVRHLGLMAVADQAYAEDADAGIWPQAALQRGDQASEGRHRRKTPGQRAGNGVGVLHPQAGQHQHRVADIWRLFTTLVIGGGCHAASCSKALTASRASLRQATNSGSPTGRDGRN